MTVEFAQWDTPFKNSQIMVLEISFSPTPASCHFRDGRYYEFARRVHGLNGPEALAINLFCFDDERHYIVRFDRVGAFRELDEHGLLELWEASKETPRPAQTTFRARNHGWSKESPVSFLSTKDGWSYFIVSDNECVEVLSYADPQIEAGDRVVPVNRPLK